MLFEGAKNSYIKGLQEMRNVRRQDKQTDSMFSRPLDGFWTFERSMAIINQENGLVTAWSGSCKWQKVVL